jgi:hypothetical protein
VLERPNDEPAGFSTGLSGPAQFRRWVFGRVVGSGALALGAEPPFGVRREDLIVKDVAPGVVAGRPQPYDRWRLARIDARTAWRGAVDGGGHGSRVDGDQAHTLPAGASAIASHLGRCRRPQGIMGAERAGAAFGVLVHAVLAQTPFDAPSRRARHDRQGRGTNTRLWTRRDAVAAARNVLACSSTTCSARARLPRLAGACRRETPVTCTLADGTLVEGVVDLAFEERGGWIVVDYKTDREIAVAARSATGVSWPSTPRRCARRRAAGGRHPPACMTTRERSSRRNGFTTEQRRNGVIIGKSPFSSRFPSPPASDACPRGSAGRSVDDRISESGWPKREGGGMKLSQALAAAISLSACLAPARADCGCRRQRALLTVDHYVRVRSTVPAIAGQPAQTLCA